MAEQCRAVHGIERALWRRADIRWSLDGAQAMLDRSVQISGEWDEFTAHRIRKEMPR